MLKVIFCRVTRSKRSNGIRKLLDRENLALNSYWVMLTITALAQYATTILPLNGIKKLPNMEMLKHYIALPAVITKATELQKTLRWLLSYILNLQNKDIITRNYYWLVATNTVKESNRILTKP